MTEQEAASLRPGRRVSRANLDDSDNPVKEYGILIRTWTDPQTGALDAHVAFFGEDWPSEGPSTMVPYVLRYFATSLALEPDADS